jgi:hypothetical protein
MEFSCVVSDDAGSTCVNMKIGRFYSIVCIVIETGHKRIRQRWTIGWKSNSGAFGTEKRVMNDINRTYASLTIREELADVWRAIGFNTISAHGFNGIFRGILQRGAVRVSALSIKRDLTLGSGNSGGHIGDNGAFPRAFSSLKHLLEVVGCRLNAFGQTSDMPTSSNRMNGSADAALFWRMSA